MATLLALACLSLVANVYAVLPDCANGPLANNTVCDSSATPVERATALVSLFTLEEKINNTGNTAPGVPRLGLPPYQYAGCCRCLVLSGAYITCCRWWQEALHGVADSPGVSFSASGEFSYATSFPQPILMGAAFDDALINAVATVVSTEGRAFGNNNHSGVRHPDKSLSIDVLTPRR